MRHIVAKHIKTDEKLLDCKLLLKVKDISGCEGE